MAVGQRGAVALAALALIAATPASGDAPAFRLGLFNGGTIGDRDVRGRLVILNFWATWCGPCKRELADLDAFATRYGSERVAVFAIDAERKPQLRSLTRQAEIMRVPIATAVLEGSDTYHPIGSAVPSTFVIDPTGHLVFARAGALSQADLDRLATLLPVSPAGRSAR